jgi:hypothetical protein
MKGVSKNQASLCGPLRISVSSVLRVFFTAENAEIRRGPQRKQTILLLTCVALFCAGCSRFHNAPATSQGERYVVISPIYNEIIRALGAQDTVVGIDLSTTYPSDVKKVQTIGYHRALSAESILSLHPTAISELESVRDRHHLHARRNRDRITLCETAQRADDWRRRSDLSRRQRKPAQVDRLVG